MVNFRLSGVPYLGGFLKGNDYCRCIMLGLDNAGKTTLLYRLQLGRQVDTIPTIFHTSNIETVQVPAERVFMTFWDIGGGCSRIPQSLFRHFQGPDALFLFVVDPTEIFHPNGGAQRAHYAVEELKFALKRIEDAKYLAVVLNKRDQTDRDDPRVEKQISEVKEVLNEYRSKVSYPCEFYDDLEQLSGATGAQTDLLLTRLARVAKMEGKAVREASMKKEAPTPLLNLNPSKPSREELLRKIEIGSKDVNSLLRPDEFMRRMILGDLEKWDHQSHLRAGFLALTECILRESVVFDTADLFLERLDKMLKAAPEKFRNTSHRTLTIFWLHQIYHAMLYFREKTGSFPAREKFNEFLSENPDLMHGRSWDMYYSKDVLFSPAAKNGWKLPDRQPLPHFMSRRTESQQEAFQTRETNRDKTTQIQISSDIRTPEILKRFAFATLKTMRLANRRRAAVINETMPILQTQIMRLRASSLTTTTSSSSSSPLYATKSTARIEPYSETQAYFWIQMLHAAIESVPVRSGLDIRSLNFESFRILFPELLAADDIWKQYYTDKLWTSIEGRRRTVLPDLNPFPNVLQAPSQSRVQQAITSTLDEKYWYYTGDTSSLSSPSLYGYGRPSVEELFLEVSWAVKEAGRYDVINSPIPGTHAMLIYCIFSSMLDIKIQHGGSRKRTVSLSHAAWDAVSFLHQQQQDQQPAKDIQQKFTAAVFWSRMVLRAFIETDDSYPFHSKFTTSLSGSDPTHHKTSPQEGALRAQFFEKFLRRNPELCWEGLWRLYYSDELWRSEDARITYVAPDRRGIPAFVGRVAGDGKDDGDRKEMEVRLGEEREAEKRDVVLDGEWEIVDE